MTTRPLHLRHLIAPVLGIAGFTLAIAASPSAHAQGDSSAPAGTTAAPAGTDTNAPAAGTTPPSDDEAKKKGAATTAPAAAGAGATPAPTTGAAPATGEAGTSITISTGATPKKDEPGAAKPAEEPPPPAPNPFRGSIMILDQSMTTNTFSKGAQLSYSPVYEWWISPRVRYNFQSVKGANIQLRQDVFKEWTNSQDVTADRSAWRYTDTWLTGGINRPLKFISDHLRGGIGFQFRPGVSRESRMAGQYFTLGPSANLGYSFDLAGEKAKAFKSMSISLAGIYTHSFSRCNVPCNDGFEQAGMNTKGEQIVNNSVRTQTMVGNQLVYILSASVDIVEHLDLSTMMIWISQFANRPSDATFAGQEVPRGDGDTRIRQWSWFFTSLSYGLEAVNLKEVTVAVGYWNFNNVLGFDGKYRNPFWSPEARVFFDVIVHLDEVYEHFLGKDDAGKAKGGTGSGRLF